MTVSYSCPGIMELSSLGLNAFQNALTGRTDTFEFKFQVLKALATGKQISHHGAGGESLVMRREVTLSTLRFVVQGGIWGRRGEYTASTSARSLRDHQVKLSGLDRAHPVVRKITRHLGVLPTSSSSSSAFTATSSSSAAAASSSSPSSTTWTGVGSWEVTSLGKPFSVSSEADSDTAVLF